jgi:acyl transferase domain-containing protein/acyl carrier protein
MADDPNVPEQLKAALLGLRKLKARVAELESARQAPIAVVGVGCRFPGCAADPESFWQQILAGGDAVGPVPSDRWDLSTWLGEAAARAPGLRHGGFLDDVYGFDADAFHISPREARAMDPQQRLLLEVSWEALEHAGLIARVEGSQTGVFLGVALTDWEQRTLRHPDPDAMDLYAGTGSFNSVAAGRISYALGLRGPSVALDTACSSSLVAIHLACQSLRSGECSIALAGGANLLLSPDPTLYFSRMGALAPDGRCKTFDASADGYVRSEGVGVVVLKRLDDALRDGDRVLAVVRGSAVNQDGRSNGLTAPNPDAQRAVLRAALANAGVSAAEVGLVETHGTGTPLGDPIEVDALRSVYGEGSTPLALGAAKSQFGHAEAAAGILGFVKAVQAVRHGQIPANLHLHTPNPRLNLAGSRLTLPRVTAPWGGPRVAAVSGFGMSGTNAHVVLSEAPAVAATTTPRAVRVLTLSGRDEATLAALSAPVRKALETAPWADACATASSGRIAARVRRAIVAASAEEAIAALGRGDGVAGEVGGAGRVGLVLGSVDAETVAAIRAEEPAFGPIVDRLMAGLQASADDARGIVALVALAELLASWGVNAHAVSGSGDGRWAAGVIAGVLPLDVAIAASRTFGDGRRAVLSAARLGEARCYVGTTRGALVASGLDSVDVWMDDAAVDGAVAMVAEGLALVSIGAANDGALPAVGADLPRVWANLLAALWVRGVPVDWRVWQPGHVVDWPTTPFRHTRYFLDDPMEAQRAAAHRDERVWATVERAVDLPLAAPRRWCVVSAGPKGAALAAALGATIEPAGGVDVVDATALDHADAGATLALAQRVTSVGARLHLVLPDAPADADVAAVRGLGAVLATELSAAWGGLLVVDDVDAHAIADALQRADGRDLRRTADGLVERRLEHATLGPATWTPRADGTWWLTGGLGELGLRVAGWLVALGVTRLVLTARRAPGPEATAQIDAWRARGVDVRVAQADVSRADDVAQIRGAISDLRGLIHLAGVVDDAPFGSLDAARLDAVLAPKQQGTQHLDAATRDADLDAFVVMGSASATLGVFGQAAYAAANEAAAAVVEARVRAGFPGLCAVFGPWDAGMADAAVRRRLEALGVVPLATDEALSLLGRALAQPGSARLFLRLDAARYAASTGAPRVAHLLGQPLKTHAAAAPAVERASWRVALTRALAEVLGFDGDPDPTRGLFELGLDSMTAVAFAARVEKVIGRPVPPTLAFDHGTLEGVIAWAEGDVSPASMEAPRAPTDEPIAIVGMAMRFPGGANDPEAFWKLLVDGVDAIGPVPPSRWSADALYDPTPGAAGKVIVREGAFLDDVASFDAEFFGIAPREALSLDPQQRLLLEVGVEALERAAIPLDGLLRRSVGVFVGIGPSDYGRRFDALHGERDLYAGTGNEASFAAGRLAYALGVQGPAIGLNTACSTSLVTTHLACQALRAGECELALAGGVNLMLSPETTVQLSALSALSPNGRCRTFDADADGYARGEGCGVLVLKRLSDAVRDGDPILAVIRASTVNHDGPSAGLTVPSGDAQARLLTTTLARAGLRGEDVGFLEAHGTGTRLGDPIEVGAVGRAYGARPADRPLVMSSVKTHIGHLELAAGVAGLASAVLTLRHKRFAPHLHLKRVNPALDLSFPVRIPTAAAEWTSARSRVASVSSFGLSGTNANVLVEEAPELPSSHDRARRWQVLRLSATAPEVLRAYALRLADALDGSALRLDDVANTLRIGRTARVVRAAVVASTVAEAADRLRGLAGTPAAAAPWRLARATHASVIAPRPDADRHLAELVASWFCAGVPDEAPTVPSRRIELPSTPWRLTRFWVPRVADEGEVTVPGAAQLHRLTWVTHPTRANVSGPWTLIADRGGVALSVAEALRSRGQQVSLVDALGVATGCVVDLRPCDGGDTIDDASLRGAFQLVRPVAEGQARLWVVTAGVSEGLALPSAGVVGLMRGLARELPASTGGWIDVVDVVGFTALDAVRIADALLDGETQLRVRGGVVERPSLVHDEGRPIDRTHGTWWITGGLGALGLHVARALVALGAERLVLTGRTAPTGEVAAALDRLRAGVPVDVRLADVTDPDAIAAIADELGASLVGVVHAAGALSDATLRDSDWARFSAPIPTKRQGAWNLHRATLGLALEHFVLFSSAAGTFGWTGQAGYAAANTALDALALYRRAKGLPATSVAFGPWSGAGMADARVADAMASVGMRALSPQDALGALRRALGGGHATWVALDLDAAMWARSQPGSASLVSSLLPAEAAASTSPLARLPLRERTERVVEAVRATVASALGHADGAALDGSRGLFDMGLDSLTAVQVSRGLARRTELVVPDTVAFDQPSIDALVAWCLAQLQDAVTPDDAPATAGGDEPIAVVGMGLRMPGGVADPDAFWSLLADGRDAIVPVPADRWDVAAWFDPTPGVPGRLYVREGGFVGDVAGFEPGVFGISPKEAARLDPQQRLLLECAWEALERAGVAPDSLRDTPTAVFVGVGGHDYERVIERAGPADADDAYTGTGNDPAFAAGRISYVLGARGPALSLNTACSSSLVATHLGVRSLRAGESSLALVGGVRLMLSPEETLRLSALRALSPGSRCRTFDADADGYVRGEGCGVLVLERLSDARRHGHPVLAVIAGSAVNHDGASGGLTVPSGAAQAALLRGALADAGLRGDDVDVLEAHGTGTPLGDPIELNAVGSVLGDRPGARPLIVGSV